MGREGEEEGSSKKPVSYFDKPAEKEPEKRGGFSTEDRQMIKALMKKEEEQVLCCVLDLVLCPAQSCYRPSRRTIRSWPAS